MNSTALLEPRPGADADELFAAFAAWAEAAGTALYPAQEEAAMAGAAVDAATAGTAQARPVATERREISMRGTPVRAHKRIQVHTIRFVKAGVFGYGRRCI